MKFAILAVLLLSCTKTTPSASAAPASNKGIELSYPSFTIMKDGVAGLVATKEGLITMQGKPIGKFGKSYSIVSMDGKVLASIDPQHMVVDGSGQPLVRLDAKGTLDNGSGVPISWSKDGHLLKATEDMGFTLVPNNPEVYEAASMVLFLWLSVGSAEVGTPSSAPPPEH